jgi:hypothetical protein
MPKEIRRSNQIEHPPGVSRDPALEGRSFGACCAISAGRNVLFVTA